MTDFAADATVGAVTVDPSCTDLVMCNGADCAAEPVEVCGEVDDAGGALDRVVNGDEAAVDVNAAVDVIVVVDDVVVVTAHGVASVDGCVGMVVCADDVDFRSRSAAVRACARGVHWRDWTRDILKQTL